MFGKKKKKKEEPTDFFDTLRMDDWREEEDQPNPDLAPKTYNYRGQELTEKQWQHLLHGPRGSRLEQDNPWLGASGSSFDDKFLYPTFNSTGTVPYPSLHLDNPRNHNLEFDIEALWEKMYEHAMAVIVVCDYCGVPQAIDNGTCMQCGGALPKPKRLGK